jgi:glyoxylase-like metal-dependent hydrolase (beta-lactamase superfamily II)
MNRPGLAAFFDVATSSLTYVLWDRATLEAAAIDPVLHYDPATQMVSTAPLQEVGAFLRKKNLRLSWILETHAHADHLSGARELREMFPGSRWAMGERMSEVFAALARLNAWKPSKSLGDLAVDRWLQDGETVSFGEFEIQVLSTPGHTPACLTYRVRNWLFTGDALMMPDCGVGRCDFPGGSASSLYDSIWGKLYAYPDEYEVFCGHDYQPGGRGLRYRCLLGEEKKSNVYLTLSTAREEFVRRREARDKTLAPPRLLQVSLDWNLGVHALVPRPS